MGGGIRLSKCQFQTTRRRSKLVARKSNPPSIGHHSDQRLASHVPEGSGFFPHTASRDPVARARQIITLAPRALVAADSRLVPRVFFSTVDGSLSRARGEPRRRTDRFLDARAARTRVPARPPRSAFYRILGSRRNRRRALSQDGDGSRRTGSQDRTGRLPGVHEGHRRHRHVLGASRDPRSPLPLVRARPAFYFPTSSFRAHLSSPSLRSSPILP